MNIRTFKTVDEMTLQVTALLSSQLVVESAIPRAIMLSGGRTPLPAYRQLSVRPVRAPFSMWFLFSDERMVPMVSPDNNFSAAKAMIAAAGVPEERVIRVHTEVPLVDAAARYERDLNAYFAKGGQIGLGLLGLGSDGHTASIFSMEDAYRGRGHLAIGVPHPADMDRVTVTPDLLGRVERIVVLASGDAKKEIIEKFSKTPLSTAAGHALARCRNVELWVSGITLEPAGPAKGPAPGQAPKPPQKPPSAV
jgi:6-phosphogluconolactonase